MKPSRKFLLLAVIFFCVIAGAFIYKHAVTPKIIKVPIPEAKPYTPPVIEIPKPANQKPPVKNNSPVPATPPVTSGLPAEVNLAIPFTSQAPYKKWEEPYGEFCEEASVLMAASYIKGESIPNPDVANAKLFAIKDFEDRVFGYYEDTNAAETVRILKEFYGITQVVTQDNPTLEDIKKALAAGKAVLAPFAGRDLNNPNFQHPGPLYHMLVIKGYTKDGHFITNDPGTRLGADFIYTTSNIMEAMHDWVPEDIYQGKKVIIIVG